MSIHLVGGGTSVAVSGSARALAKAGLDAQVYGPFLAEAGFRATAAGRTEPRIAIITVHEDSSQEATSLADALTAAGPIDAFHTFLARHETASLLAIADVDGIVVGGNKDAEYMEGSAVLVALAPIAGEIRRQVASGIPFLGYSTGAMIASERAIVGGCEIGGVPVSPAASSSNERELLFEAGLGLLDVTVEAHAAQSGNVSRLIAATEAGMIEGGLAIDDNTVLIVGTGKLSTAGSGSVWSVSQAEAGVVVSTFSTS